MICECKCGICICSSIYDCGSTWLVRKIEYFKIYGRRSNGVKKNMEAIGSLWRRVNRKKHA